MVNKLPLEIILIFIVFNILGSTEDLILSSTGIKLTTAIKI